MIEVPKETWISPKLYVGDSQIDGQGIVAAAEISPGELLIIWGGVLFTQSDLDSGLAKNHTNVAIGEGLYLALPADQPMGVDDYMNHSCDPNVWLVNEITLVARRGIRPGDEVTGDYATWQTNEGYVMKKECKCGSALCRRRITGRDYLLPELQKRYQGHFAPFLNERIERQKRNTTL